MSNIKTFKGSSKSNTHKATQSNTAAAKKATAAVKKTTQAAPANKEATEDLMAQIMLQTQGKFFGKPSSIEDYKATNMVVGKNGIFSVRKTPIALFTTEMVKFPEKDKINGLPVIEEGPELLIPKIPFKYHQMVLQFYRDVNERDKTEASVLFYWNHNNVELPTRYKDGSEIKGLSQDGQLIIYCPTQVNSGTLSDFRSDGMVPWLKENCTGLLETHSHNTMGAFWSGTDNANENVTQFYGVWGKVTSEKPEFLFRWVCGESKVDVSPSILFDIPQVETIKETRTVYPGNMMEPVVKREVVLNDFDGPWPEVEYPDDWFGQHTKQVYKPKTYGSYAGRGANTKKTTNYATQKTGGTTSSKNIYGSGYYDDYYDDDDGWNVGEQVAYAFEDDATTYIGDEAEGYEVPEYLDTPIYEESKKKDAGTLKIAAHTTDYVEPEMVEEVKKDIDLVVKALEKNGYEDHIVEVLKK